MQRTEACRACAPSVAEAPAPAVAPDVVSVPPAEVAAKLAGKWQGIVDAKSIVTITPDTWTNEYTGDDTVHIVARWRAFPGTERPADMTDYTFTPTSTYIESISDSGKFYYELGAVEADSFELFYVGRGNRVAYTRLK